MVASGRAHLIVVGNAKGGTGKSTIAMHIIGRLLATGHKVAAVDLDASQATLGRYIENRAHYVRQHGLNLVVPEMRVIEPSNRRDRDEADSEVRDRLVAALKDLHMSHDFIVIDCPGSDSFIARIGHAYADTLVTPINDSFVDFDLLAYVNPETYKVGSPSVYSEMVWEQRKRRHLADGHHIDWIVLRSRFSHSDTHNKRRLDRALKVLSSRIGFRAGNGLGERVIFRELFTKGLTLSDLQTKGVGVEMTMSHVAAHTDVREMMATLQLPARKAQAAAVTAACSAAVGAPMSAAPGMDAVPGAAALAAPP